MSNVVIVYNNIVELMWNGLQRLVAVSEGLTGVDLPQLPLPVIDGNATKVMTRLADPASTGEVNITLQRS